MANCTDVVLPVIQKALDCLIEQLAACGVPVAYASLVPGSTPGQLCCAATEDGDGQAWASARSIAPDPGEGTNPCGWMYRVEAILAIQRCTPVVDDQGIFPSAEELDDAATQMYLDAAMMRQALVCCWPAAAGLDRDDWGLGAWTATDPSGGCAGGVQSFWFITNDCRCA